MAVVDRSTAPLEGPLVNRITIRSVVANLSYYRVATGNFSTLVCPSCRGSLDIHQPNLQQPDQFLGTCSLCGRWYRVASSIDETGLTVLELPEVVEITSPPPPPPASGRKA
jgi:hypothetical protein